ncbi:uncharacterized protein UV8b_03366 [Ustilaginoidea virens]|uniref:Uncharacterized protein n=1 Tax=Ustilaginoidea virens TaxID=1159556 RepID=A0A063C544_USTVR|nr:uncharacterized protein UV8b_03366 [Ustilaginoidea virens]QUC19125.1 hypothetical protein UV8b_03366 [Ustilaginoidea virens]GAO18937.1 hypothetical protein UVI_02058790 [Ustilaginoidea virens]
MASAALAIDSYQQDILVDRAPDYVRPYVLPRYHGRAVLITPSQVARYSVTADSSGGAFSLLQHNGRESGWTSARPHAHRVYHEHFYCARGRCELWAVKNESTATQEARVATPGDYGNVPPGSIHTFQLTDPDSQLAHVFHPAGFERLFDEFNGGDFPAGGVSSPYLPLDADPEIFGPMTSDLAARFAALDLYTSPPDEFIPRRDLVNGTAGDDHLHWHDGPNALSAAAAADDDATAPYFVAKDYGPKFLNFDNGYKIIQPLATPAQSTHRNFTMGTIIMSPRLRNESANAAKLPHHFAVQMEDGQLVLDVQGYKTASLLPGDVAFVPAGVEFTYSATVPYTKFLYLNGGAKGLEYGLLKRAVPWKFTAYPIYAGFRG